MIRVRGLLLLTLALALSSCVDFFYSPIISNGPYASEEDGNAAGDISKKERKRALPYYRWPTERGGEFDPDVPDSTDIPKKKIPLEYDVHDHVASGKIKIGSFNIKNFGPNKSKRLLFPKDGKADVKNRNMARFIADYVQLLDLDVVAFQEVVGGSIDGLDNLEKAMKANGYRLATKYIRPLRRKTEKKESWTRKIGTKGNQEFCPIFYKKETIKLEGIINQIGKVKVADIQNKERFAAYAYFAVKPSKGEKRAVQLAKKKGKHPFDFVMASFHAPTASDPKDQAVFMTGMAKVFPTLSAIDPDVIYAGDFNMNPRDNSKAVQGRWKPLTLTKPPFGLNIQFKNKIESKGTSIHNHNVFDDLLWTSSTEEDYAKVKVIEYGFDQAFVNKKKKRDKTNQNRVSDHYPVWAMFHKFEDSD